MTDPANRTGTKSGTPPPPAGGPATAGSPGVSTEDGIYSGLPNTLRRALDVTDPANRAGAKSGTPAPPPAGGHSIVVPPPVVPSSRLPGSAFLSPGGTPPTTAPPLGLPGISSAPSPATAPGVEFTPPSPKQLLAAALREPVGTGVSGRHYALLDVLGGASERSKRLKIAHAYWHLVYAVADLRFCVDQRERIGQLRVGTVDAKLLRAAEGFSQRELEAAELSATEAQYELAEAAGLPEGAALPLPSDWPHVGTYSTRFAELFATRQPPRGTRLIDRTLPLRKQAIEVRCSAVGMAEAALETVAGSYSAGQVDLGAVLASIREWTRQRRAWMAAVCDYNHAIADYALVVVGPETAGRDLVSMLIELEPTTTGQPAGSRGASAGAADSGVLPAEFLQAVPDHSAPVVAGPPAQTPTPAGPPTDRAGGSSTGRPTLAPPRDLFAQPSLPASAQPSRPAAAAGSSGQPTLAPPRDETGAAPASGASPEKPAAAAPAANTPLPDDGGGYDGRLPAELPEAPRWSDSSGVAPGGTTRPGTTISRRALVPVAPLEKGPVPYRAYKLPSSLAGATDGLRYAALSGLAPAVRTSRLAVRLFTGVGLPKPGGRKVSLESCLQGQSAEARRGLIAAYWTAAQRVAEYGACVERAELLDELASAVMLGTAGTPEAVARIRAMRLAADADILEAQVRLLGAEFELTRLAGRPLDSAWLVPSTPPHAGPYALRIEAQPRWLVESWPVRRLAVTIPALSQSVAGRAAEVMAADADRAAAIAEYRLGRLTFDAALGAIEHQVEETSALVESVGAYNQSIADYALRVLPSAIPGDRLVSTLVVVR